jgi:transposase
MEDGTSILFGLPGVAVDRVERFTEDGSVVRLVHMVTAAASAAGCPSCRGGLHVGEAVPDDPAA